MAKRHNPSTSKAAYDSVRDHVIPSHHQKILDALQKHGEGIYEEIAGWCGFKDKNMVSRRLLELENLGKIARLLYTKRTSSGRKAFAYRIIVPKPPQSAQNQVIQQSLFK